MRTETTAFLPVPSCVFVVSDHTWCCTPSCVITAQYDRQDEVAAVVSESGAPALSNGFFMNYTVPTKRNCMYGPAHGTLFRPVAWRLAAEMVHVKVDPVIYKRASRVLDWQHAQKADLRHRY
jgi:hypothetical protein